MGQTVKRGPILLVEDSQDDVFFTREAFTEARILNAIEVVVDGVEALRFLQREGKYRTAQTPAVVLLDLHMPKKSGFELLREMKDDRVLRMIPVIVLTESHLDIEILQGYRCHPDGFIKKPVVIEHFLNALKALPSLGFPVIQLSPSRPRRVKIQATVGQSTTFRKSFQTAIEKSFASAEIVRAKSGSGLGRAL